MAEPARPSRAAPLRHDAVLEAVTFAAERLLLAADWHDAIDEVLARFGIAVGVSRVTVVRVDRDDADAPIAWGESEWCAPEVPTMAEHPSLQGAPWLPDFARWVDAMTAGQPIVGDVETFPGAERSTYASQGIRSLAYYPVTVEGGWWGCIGFEDCDEPHAWTLSELDGIRTAAAMVGAAITRQRQEARLRDAETRYRGVVERIPAVTYVDVSGPDAVRMAFLSPQIEVLLGHPPERFLDDPDSWFDLVHPDDQERVDAAARHAGATGERFEEEYRMRHADGHWVWVHDTSTPVPDPEGEDSTYFQGFLVDITARMEAEEARAEAEHRYRTMVEALPAVTYIDEPIEGEDLNAAMPFVSPQIENILGYPPERFMQDSRFWFEVMHSDDFRRMRDAGELSVSNLDEVTQEYRMRHADGHWVWVEDTSKPVYDEDGQLLFFQGFLMDVTERREAEAELQRARERLQALIDHIPACVYREAPDADPTKFFMSSQVEQMLGYTAEEWTWTPNFWVDRIHPDDKERVLALDDESGRTLRPYSHEYRFRRSDGTYVWLQDEAVFLRSGPDDEGAWQGLLFDVTARKEAEEQLRASELVHSATVEHLPAIIYREPPDGPGDPGMYVSPQAEQILGYTPEEWVTSEGDFWLEHIHPDDLEGVAAANATANATKEPFAIEYRIRHADGTYRWLHDEATFVPDIAGAWWQGFMIDITARREAEDQLRDAEERFRLIVERGPAVFYQQEFDPDDPDVSRTTYVSPQQTSLFGYTTEEMMADPTLWAKTIHPDDRERVLSADVASNRNADEQFSMEYRMISKDGRIVWVQDTCSLVHAPGRTPYWQGFLLDITERKHAEEQLERALEVEREATRRLRALDEMKNTFLQAVSHDLRTPLAAILGLAITLERGDVHLEEDDARDLARRIAGNARRLDRLVTNLLDLDRLARGIVAPNLQPTDVGSVVRRVISESELIADARLSTDIHPVMVQGDGSKIERIVENLLANTVRHTPPTSTVWVAVTATEEGALLVVADDGTGVPEDIRETIFEPFQQGPNAPRHSPGVGVGLTLVRRFAELHGGRAWVEDRDGGGASFRVFLPYEAS